MSESTLDQAQVPTHIAIIMDGNGRWAQRQGLPRIEGHRHGVKVVRKIVKAAASLGLKQLTLYCLSSENWKRPATELSFLMFLLEKYLAEEHKEIMKQDLRFRTIGHIQDLPKGIVNQISRTIEDSRNNNGMTLCLAINYGARAEIVDAVRQISEKVSQGVFTPAEIDETTISNHLHTAGMPDPDLVIRTSGELRISNYLLWQISYSELWVTQKHWPEFSETDFQQAILDYNQRDRRYGGLSD